MDLARMAATRATCPRRKVGAVLVTTTRMVLTTGYNGSPAGAKHCTDIGCLLLDGEKCDRTIHAEINAIGQAAANGVQTQGSILYSTHLPCLNCAKAIAAARISRVWYKDDASDRAGTILLEDARIPCIKL